MMRGRVGSCVLWGGLCLRSNASKTFLAGDIRLYMCIISNILSVTWGTRSKN